MVVIVKLIPIKLSLKERIAYLINGLKMIIQSILWRDYLALDLGFGYIENALHGYLYELKFINADLTNTSNIIGDWCE